MKVAVDAELCSGHGRCYTVAPKLFSPDDVGFNAQAGQEFVVPDDAGDVARLAIRSCPEGAIIEIGT